MAQNSGGPTIVGAVVLAVAVVAGSYIVKGSLDSGTAELESLRTAVVDLQKAVKESAAARPAPAPARADRPRRPDPNQRYTVNTKGSPAKGGSSPKVTVVEFSDFQCPFCRRVGPTLAQIEEAYGDDVQVVFKHLPLRIHPKAPAAHAASEAAHKQGKFWEMHDLIFENQREMSEEKYVEYATQLGLDVEQFKKDVVSAEIKARLDADQKEAERLGVSGTPAFFINGKYLSGAQPFDNFKRVIDEELKKKG
ncbi:MAG: DsbA family protein [Myxococcota bacterium]|nr:DsbA family protein [Myxococcota bacterium]